MRSSQDDVHVDSPNENYAIALRGGESVPAALLRALKDDFTNRGGQAISLLRTKHPHDYLKIILSLSSSENETKAKKGVFDDVSTDELRSILQAVRAGLADAAQPQSDEVRRI